MSTNTSERRIERSILDTMTGRSVIASSNSRKVAGEGGWVIRSSEDYDPSLGMDGAALLSFLEKTQITGEPERNLPDLRNDTAARQAFLMLLRSQITERGIIDVLRRGVDDGQQRWDLFFGMRSPVKPGVGRRFTQNRFSVIPRLQHSQNATQVDICLFVNGLPIATMGLADASGETAADVMERYRSIRDPRNLLFAPGRCMAHFAVDQQQVLFSSELRGEATVFWPFNQGTSEQAGNTTRLFGIGTDYLWREILTRPGVIDLIENYAQTMQVSEPGGDARTASVFPRFHQLEAVRRVVADTENHNVGHRLLMLHAAGSGTSYTIAWLIRQLMRAEQDSIRIFDSIVILTNRASVVQRLQDAIRRFPEVSVQLATGADVSDRFHSAVEGNVNLITAPVEGLTTILDEIGRQHGRRFALIIDESPDGSDAPLEDQVNAAMSGRENYPNVSAFVFAPSANQTTSELFGRPFNDRGVMQFLPFHEHRTA